MYTLGQSRLRGNSMLLVQCDFDDTISVGNVSIAIREAFGPGEWRRMDEEYHAGKYSVEESNIRQFALVPATAKDIEDFVFSEVVVRDGFADFVEYCRSEGVRLVVVSSGLDLYIDPTLRRIGLDHLEVHSGQARVNGTGIRVEYADPSGSVIVRGFKESFLRDFKRSGNTVAYIGDGLSDIVPAGEADFVIARSTLRGHLKAEGIPFYSFETFNDVRGHVEGIRQLIES